MSVCTEVIIQRTATEIHFDLGKHEDNRNLAVFLDHTKESIYIIDSYMNNMGKHKQCVIYSTELSAKLKDKTSLPGMQYGKCVTYIKFKPDTDDNVCRGQQFPEGVLCDRDPT